jgi:phospholipid/cholesterol/gamma-HCH transport system substrate-binding protein
MNRLLTPFRVGLVVIAGIAAFFVLLSFLGRQKYNDKQTYKLYATFIDASGLGPKSRIQIAGIEVGIVERIELTPEAHARALLRIKKDVVLREDARITKRSASLLGDYLLDVFPGTIGKPPLADGAEIHKVLVQPGMEDVFSSLGDVTRDIQGITTSLKDLLGGDQIGSIKDIIRSMNEVAQGLNKTIERAGGRLDHILGDVEALSGDVRTLARGESKNVEEILYNVRSFTDQANKVMLTLNKIVGSGEGDLKESVASVRETLEQLQRTLKGAENIITSAQGAVDDTRHVIARVDKGEGTLGKLVRDDGIAVKFEKTLSDVNNLLAPISELQTQVHLREELHWHPGALGGQGTGTQGKSIVQIRLAPKPDKYYAIELTSEPRGKITRQTVVTKKSPIVEGQEVPVQETQTSVTTNDLKFSAYIAKRYGNAAMRIGLIESTGGVGADVFGLGDRVRVSVDAFDWANPDASYPRLRLSAQGTFLDHLYLGVGVDDVMNGQKLANGSPVVGRDFFATGGLQFTDDDLKTILTVMGAPKVQ